MQITIKSTDHIVHLAGVPCRMWDGVCQDGTPCTVFVHRIRVCDGAHLEKFEQELVEQSPAAEPVAVALPGSLWPPVHILRKLFASEN